MAANPRNNGRHRALGKGKAKRAKGAKPVTKAIAPRPIPPIRPGSPRPRPGGTPSPIVNKGPRGIKSGPGIPRPTPGAGGGTPSGGWQPRPPGGWAGRTRPSGLGAPPSADGSPGGRPRPTGLGAPPSRMPPGNFGGGSAGGSRPGTRPGGIKSTPGGIPSGLGARPTRGASSAAPGQLKKAAGLQSARSLAPGRSRKRT